MIWHALGKGLANFLTALKFTTQVEPTARLRLPAAAGSLVLQVACDAGNNLPDGGFVEGGMVIIDEGGPSQEAARRVHSEQAQGLWYIKGCAT